MIREHFEQQGRSGYPEAALKPDENDDGEGVPEAEEPAAPSPPETPEIRSDATGGVPPGLFDVLRPADPSALLLNEAGRLVFANESIAALLDHDSPDELVDLHFTAICAHELAWLETQFQRLKTQNVWSGHVGLRRKDGGVVHVSANVSTLPLDAAAESIYIAFVHAVAGEVRGTATALDDLPYGLDVDDVRLLQLLTEGFRIEEVAALFLETEASVHGRIEAIGRKMQVSSPVEACVVALKRHILG